MVHTPTVPPKKVRDLLIVQDAIVNEIIIETVIPITPKYR